MLDVRDHIEVVRENIITTKRTKQLKDIKIKNINYICFFLILNIFLKHFAGDEHYQSL